LECLAQSLRIPWEAPPQTSPALLECLALVAGHQELFVQLEKQKKWDIRLVEGILNFVFWLGEPAVVRSEEIDIIKKFLQEFERVEVKNTAVGIADEVIVKQGVLMNYKGIVVEVMGNKARVNIESMGIALVALFDATNLEVVK
jgi:transcription antitermination factor NusG